MPNPVGLDASALALLTAYDWPGNIRQLENAVFRAVVLSQGEELADTDFPQIALQLPEFAAMDDTGDAIRSPSGSSLKLAAYSPPPPLAESHAIVEEATDVSTTIYRGGNLISSMDEAGNIRKLAEIEEELIRFALRFYRGQMSQVARKLGIGRSTLYRKLKDYGIDPDDPLRDAA